MAKRRKGKTTTPFNLALSVALKNGTEGVVVVKIDGNNNSYSYYTGGKDYPNGSRVIVPVQTGGPLHATVIMQAKARRWIDKANKTIIGMA